LKRQQWHEERAAMAASEETLRKQYEQERAAALQKYLTHGEGRARYLECHAKFLEFYRAVEPGREHETAHAKAVGKVDQELFQFPDFGIWLLEQGPATA
jgi:hypothetical protein